MKVKQLTGKVQVIGFGIAGLGIALAADRQNCLDELCHEGLIYLDKRKIKQLDSLCFDIMSNSPAEEFLAGISSSGLFSEVLQSNKGKALQKFGRREVPLTLTSEFFNEVAERLDYICQLHQNSGFLAQTHVDSIRLEPNGWVTTYNALDEPLVTSQFAVIATGGAEASNQHLKSLALSVNARYVNSEKILRGQYDQDLYDVIVSGEKVTILGGSHSAFSVVEYLLRKFSHVLQDGQIQVLTKSSVKLHYSNIEEFNQCSQSGEKGFVDIETRGINRYCGLRGNARQAFIDVVQGKQTKVSIQTLGNFRDVLTDKKKQEALFVNSGVIIQAMGYRSVHPKIIDASGGEIICDQSHGFLTVSKDYQVRDKNKQALQSIFAMGLGSFVAPEESLQSTVEIPVGVNIYHHFDATVVLRNIMNSLDKNNLESSLNVASKREHSTFYASGNRIE